MASPRRGSLHHGPYANSRAGSLQDGSEEAWFREDTVRCIEVTYIGRRGTENVSGLASRSCYTLYRTR